MSAADSLMLQPGLFYIGHFHQEIFVGGHNIGNVITTIYREVGNRREYYVHARHGRYNSQDRSGPVVDKHFDEQTVRLNTKDDRGIYERWREYLGEEAPKRINDDSGGRVVLTLAQAHPVMGDHEEFMRWMLGQDHIQIEYVPREDTAT